MPMMDKLIADLNTNPPQTPEELEDMLSATGYSLEVSDGEMGLDPEGMPDEGPEYEEDMGPEEEPMGVSIAVMEEMPPSMPMMPSPLNDRGKRKQQVMQAAKKAMRSEG